MRTLSELLGGLVRPVMLAGLVIIVLGLLSDHSGTGAVGSGGFECRGFTNDADLNRVICQYHPARLWNMPVTDLLPWLNPAASVTQEAIEG